MMEAMQQEQEQMSPEQMAMLDMLLQQQQQDPQQQLVEEKSKSKYMQLAHKVRQSEQNMKVAQAQYEADLQRLQAESGQF